MNEERKRLAEDRIEEADRKKAGQPPGGKWKKWGPYLTERQWGTVREDYSHDGSAWDHVTHEQARSKAYRWGEEGIAGICDSEQTICFALSMWNANDSILKERLFGVAGEEGNHGEDCKEQYYYLESTPTHSYMKMLYKYPQGAYPYTELVEENKKRGRDEPEYEILDTGIFDENRYFDIFIEYAKSSPDDICIRITAENRGPEDAPLWLLPCIWFRNTWSIGKSKRPSIALVDKDEQSGTVLKITAPSNGDYHLFCEPISSTANLEVLFCENETNYGSLFGMENGDGYYKDGINDCIVDGKTDSINAKKIGSRAAINYHSSIPAGGKKTIRMRLIRDSELKNDDIPPSKTFDAFADFNDVFDLRNKECDHFYGEIQAGIEDEDERLIQRQAFAGMLWSKQFFYYDVEEWLSGDPGHPTPPPERWNGRNKEWAHLNNADVISMPDKWEYPWYAAWDLAFHCIPLAMLDPDFAKRQLILLTREWYMHPNGQLPAYEWAFGDVNPPVHAWAAWRVFQIEREQIGGPGDIDFLEAILHKLMLNFTWWVNRKDADGNNLFTGGFLGLDNIGVFDRSKPLPTGGCIEQSDGTSWMAMYALNLMRISLEIALHRPIYQDIATKFFEHFMYIAGAMSGVGERKSDLWDDEDEFYYDVLRKPNGESVPLKIQSMVGFIPMFAVEVLDPVLLEKLPEFRLRLEWFLEHRPELAKLVSRWHEPGRGETRLFSLLRGHRLKRLLARMLDQDQFFSDFGVRALSRTHRENPYEFDVDGETYKVTYSPGESESGLFGGNSNWRGPVWMPVNFLIVESLRKFHHYYGDDFTIEYPIDSGQKISIGQAADEIARRLISIFKTDADGRRPVFGCYEKLNKDPMFSNYILFHEYFHGDNGCGIGASHQTGWTGLVAHLIESTRS